MVRRRARVEAVDTHRYDCDVRALCADPIAVVRLCSLDQAVTHRSIGRWRATGVTMATVSSRTKTLSSALRWAVEQASLRAHPLAGMRHPPVPLPRLPLPLDDVDRLLRAASKQVAEARGDRSAQRLFEAEQTELLVRLAADAGARRGELAALKVGDLDTRVVHICRNISGPCTVTTPKSHQYRSLTLGASTAELWRAHVERWPATSRDHDWLFAPTPARAGFVQPRGLAARFERRRDFAGVPDASLHRLRHTVAVILVAEGKLLAAQHRLGHRDLSTTLRHYGWPRRPTTPRSLSFSTASSAGTGSEGGGEVQPVLGLGVFVEAPGDAADDRCELVVVKCPDEDAASVVAVGLGPLPQQRREVPGVAGHQDAGLLGGQREHLRVIQCAERGVRCQAEHVVASFRERAADALGRQVRVEEHAQPRQASTTSMNGYSVRSSSSGRRFSAMASSTSAGYASR